MVDFLWHRITGNVQFSYYLLESDGVERTWLNAGRACALALVDGDVLLAVADQHRVLVVLVWKRLFYCRRYSKIMKDNSHLW